jgi:hypothetical protein
MSDVDPTNTSYQHESDRKPEFWNKRGESIDQSLRLFADPEHGDVWRSYASTAMPYSVFREFGLIDTSGSEEWANVVEHSTAVAGAAVTLASQLRDAGVPVDVRVVERAAWVHDASKRLDLARAISRADEVEDTNLEAVLRENGYTDVEIVTAKNTGRLPDRYIEDDDERNQAIEARSIEENIVGYVDARTRGSRFVSVDEARDDSIRVKPKDKDFFDDKWHPYYKAVEGYLTALAPEFDPDAITEDVIYESVRRHLAD